MRLQIYILLLTVSPLMLNSCSNKVEKKPLIEANKHMHKTSFQELVQRFESSERDKWQKPELVLDKIGNLEDKTVADIGAGTGYLSFKMAANGANVIAKDVDKRFIKYIDSANKNIPDSVQITTSLIPYDNPHLEELTYDLVTLLNTYHHIENRINYFFKVWKGLKDEGKLIIIDFKKKGTPHGPPTKMRLNEMEVSKELKKAGFAKILIDMNTLEEQYIITAKKVMKKENLMERSKKYDK